MQLERLRLALRRRSPWEALDLGLVMLRHWPGPVYRAWLATFVPCALFLLVLLWDWPVLAMALVWWLKPLFDRVLLKVFAEAAFDAPPTVAAVWRALPGLCRRSGLLAGLTWRRFNLQRSFDLPVWQLEGQTGKTGRARLRVLARKTSGHAFWLTFACLHFVVIFEFSFIALLEIVRPSEAPQLIDWAQFWRGEQDGWQSLAFNLGWLAAESIVEPFYVAAGFSLYLNRRSELEGWDIEVAFRRMGEQAQRAGSPARRAAGLAVLAVGLAGLLAGPAEVRAEAATPSTEASVAETRPSGEVKRAALAVLADPVFGHKVVAWRWQARETAEADAALPWWVKTLARLADMLAVGIRGLLYGLLVVAGAWLVVVLYRHRHLAFGRRAPPPAAPAALFGLDLRPESLPEDVAAAALAELDAGRPANALSLLFRGTLLALIRRQIEFRAGDTEDDCLRRARSRVDGAAADYFGQLLAAWKGAAYAGEPPPPESARALCRQWPQHFAAAPP